VAKDKKRPGAKRPEANKAKGKKAPAAKPKTKSKAAPSAPGKTVNKAVRDATAKAKELASNPAVAEIVAASLVAAAAAIKNPKKARDMAAAVGDELEIASKQAVDRGNAFWQLAIDIARRSIAVLGSDDRPAKSKSGTKKKPRK